MKKKNIIWVSSAIISCAIAIGIWYTLTPPEQTRTTVAIKPEVQTPKQQLQYMESETFATLPEKEKLNYLKRVNHVKLFKMYLKLPDESKRKLRKNAASAFKTLMMERVTHYSKLKSAEEKHAYLDRMIDEMEAFRRARRDVGISDEEIKKRRAERRKRKPSLTRIKKRIETTDPKTRAAFMEFIIDMRTRRKERGLKSFRR